MDADDCGHLRGFGDPNHKESTLQQIAARRTADVVAARSLKSTCELESEAEALVAEFGPVLSLHTRIETAEATPWRLALCAEFKRASPSKGDIGVELDVGDQTIAYADVGAAVISVLTEPTWFKGTLDDLRIARVKTQRWAEQKNVPRPLLLRKDFVVDEYQVHEALAYGADTVLLIVSILRRSRLRALLSFCREHGIEPLVEVASSEELAVALECNARVIGVNNRDLHTLSLDPERTARLGKELREKHCVGFGPGQDVKLLALSGLASAADVTACREIPCSGVLVGEALMRAPTPADAILGMMGPSDGSMGATSKVAPHPALPVVPGRILVKVCGVTRPEDARTAIESGANLIGLVMAKSKRTASLEQAVAVVAAVRRFGEREGVLARVPEEGVATGASSIERLAARAVALRDACALKPLTVGVFLNQTVDEVVTLAEGAGFDGVQLHGSEDVTFVELIRERLPSLWILKVLHLPSQIDQNKSGGGIGDEDGMAELRRHAMAYGMACDALLLDTALPGSNQSGGTGATFDWDVVRQVQDEWGMPVLVAGGLTGSNIGQLTSTCRPFGVDAASGLEDGIPGVKCPSKVIAYVRGAKRARLSDGV